MAAHHNSLLKTARFLLILLAAIAIPLLTLWLSFPAGVKIFSGPQHTYSRDIAWGLTLDWFVNIFLFFAVLNGLCGLLLRANQRRVIAAVSFLVLAGILWPAFGSVPYRSSLLLACGLLGLVAQTVATSRLKQFV